MNNKIVLPDEIIYNIFEYLFINKCSYCKKIITYDIKINNNYCSFNCLINNKIKILYNTIITNKSIVFTIQSLTILFLTCFNIYFVHYISFKLDCIIVILYYILFIIIMTQKLIKNDNFTSPLVLFIN